MNLQNPQTGMGKMTNYRWMICFMLFMATTINYMDRQVLSLTWKDFIAPEFNWTDANYGTIAGCFSLIYSIAMLFVGSFIDKIGTKKGYMWAIGIWSVGACLHTFCGIATAGISVGTWTFSFEEARQALAAAETAGAVIWSVSTVSIWLFLVARIILAVGEAGNFPCAIKVTAEYFPKKDRGFATSVFNAGAQLGALLAPFTIPIIARYWGWEMSFFIIGLLGFIWMGFWIRMYNPPALHKKVNMAELAYIESDKESDRAMAASAASEQPEKRLSLWKCFTYRQTWAVVAGRCLPDAVWWFFLFWAPAYVKDVYGYRSDSTMGMLLIFTLYLISMLSIIGGYLPTIFIDKYKMNPFAGRMRAMLIFALFPLLGLFAQPLGNISCWFPIIIIGIIGAAHQSWSANAYTVVSDMFPKSAVATVTGIGGMAGGIGSLLSNQGSGLLFTYAKETDMSFLGFQGVQAGYMIVFIVASVAYLFSWIVIKLLVPKYKLIEL